MLLDVIQCQCQAQGNKFSTEASGYHKQHLSCTTLYSCHGGQDCSNPFTSAREIVQSGETVQSREIVQSAEEVNETYAIKIDHPDGSGDSIE